MTGNIRLDVAELERAIANLVLTYPEIGEDEVLRADMFEGLGLHEVMASIVDREREAKAMASAVKARMDDLAARKARYDRQQEGWRHLIKHLMERADVPKVTLPEATLSITHRSPEPIVADEDALPDDFWKVTRTPDKTFIKQWWKDNGLLPAGTTLNNGSTSISIRVK